MKTAGKMFLIAFPVILLALASKTNGETNALNRVKRSADPVDRQGFFLVSPTPQQQVFFPQQQPVFFPQQQQQFVIFTTPPPTVQTSSWLQVFRNILLIRYITRRRTTTTDAPQSSTTPLPTQFATWHLATNGCRYEHFSDTTTGVAARVACESIGARLMVEGARGVDSASAALRLSILQATGAFTDATDSWIGLEDYDNDDNFEWFDGVPSSPSNTDWDDGSNEPDSSAAMVCGRIRDGEHLIHDGDCDRSFGRICEYCPQ